MYSRLPKIEFQANDSLVMKAFRNKKSTKLVVNQIP